MLLRSQRLYSSFESRIADGLGFIQKYDLETGHGNFDPAQRGCINLWDKICFSFQGKIKKIEIKKSHINGRKKNVEGERKSVT